ncbi:MAG TPA: hypothetical protein DCL29_05070 [Eubacterium sp.]|nr:hypothetical protein [Eubacterium sp.]
MINRFSNYTAGLEPVGPKQRKIFEEMFNNHKIFKIEPSERMSLYYSVKDDLAFYVIKAIMTGDNITEGYRLFDGKACADAIKVTVQKFQSGVKHSDGESYTEPMHYFRMIYKQKLEIEIQNSDALHVSETILKLSLAISKILLEKFGGDTLQVDKVVEILKEDPKYKNHTDSTFANAVQHAVYKALAQSLDAEDEDGISLNETVEDRHSDTERDAILACGSPILDELILTANIFGESKKEKIYRLIVTNMLLRVLKIKEGNKPFANEPAGDADICDIYALREEELMDRLFLHEYINYSIEDKPKSLKKLVGIYYNLLKTKLLNEDMANYLGRKPESFSQTRQNWERKIRKQLNKQMEEYRN